MTPALPHFCERCQKRVKAMGGIHYVYTKDKHGITEFRKCLGPVHLITDKDRPDLSGVGSKTL